MIGESIIITGGGGFVGRHLIAELQKSASFSRIIVFDRTSDGFPEDVEVHTVDIANPDTYTSLFQDIRPSWVVHLAAVSSVGFSLTHADLTRTVNVFGTETLIQRGLAARSDTKFLVISSADIYGHVSSSPLIELPLAQAHPTNPYGESKLEMERIIEDSYNEHCIRVRPFPHIGPGQSTGFVTADFASQIAAIEKGKQEPVLSVGSLTAQRDFTDVRDVVRAYRLLMERGLMGEVYHVASGQARSIQSILDMFLAISRVPITMYEDASRMRPSDNPVLVGSAEKIKKQTGWNAEIPLETSLRDILDYWRSRV